MNEQTTSAMEYQEHVEKRMDDIRSKALRRVQALYPEIPFVVDNYTVDDYCDKVWDYPGQWYCYFRLPKDVKSEQELIDKIVSETIATLKNR